MPSIWAIPGFLGLPTDWEFLAWKGLSGVDLSAFAWNSLPNWARHFNAWTSNAQNPRILMGYSLGGRLALHALIDRPHQWRAAIIVSAHVGLEDLQEREERKILDQQWAARFENEEWSHLMHAWNGREVFVHDPFHFKRLEQDYQRSQLAKILIRGSLGEQKYLRQHIESLPMPLLWVTGKNDSRYCQIAKTLSFAHPHSQRIEVEQAGHRVPWAQQQLFKKLVENFLQTSGIGF